MPNYTIGKAEIPSEDVLAIAGTRKAGYPTRGITITTSGNGQQGNTIDKTQVRSGAAAWIRDYVVQDVTDGGTRIHLDDSSAAGVHPVGWLVGADVDVYRYVDAGETVMRLNGESYTPTEDEIVLIRNDTVTAQVRQRLGTLGTLKSGSMIPSGTLEHFWSPGTKFREGADYYIIACAVDASGNVSEWSSHATFTLTDVNRVKNAAAERANVTANHPSLTGLTLDSGTFAPPANLSVESQDDGNVARITWSPVAGAVGYLLRTVETEPTGAIVEEDYVELAGDESAPVQTNDMIIFRRYLTHNLTKAEIRTNPLWNENGYYEMSREFSAYPHETDGVRYERVVDGDRKYARIHYTGSGGIVLKGGKFSSLNQYPMWYPVLEPGETYRNRMIVRAWEPDGVTPKTTGLSMLVGNTDQGMQALAWATGIDMGDGFYQIDIDASRATVDIGTGAKQVQVWSDGPCLIDVEAWWFYDARWEPRYEWAEPDGSILETSIPPFNRLHFPIRNRPWAATLEILTEPDNIGTILSETMHNALKLTEAAGMNPWLQIPWHFADEDTYGLAEWMCSRYDPDNFPAEDTPELKPWAYKRYLHGQQAPFQDVFGKILFEVENETWNSTPAFYSIPGFGNQDGVIQDAGKGNALFLERMVAILESHPDFDPSKWEYVLGGWRSRGATGAFNTPSIANTRSAHHFMFADYNGGWDEGQSGTYSPNNPDNWQAILGNSIAKSREKTARELREVLEARGAELGRTILPGSYEAGPGFPMGATGPQTYDQSAMMKSVVGGTATFDSFLMNASQNWQVQNFFAFGGKKNAQDAWGSHCSWERGGRPNPGYLWTTFFNQHFIGATVRLIDPKIEPEVTVPAGWDNNLDVAKKAVGPALGLYRIDQGAKTYVAICSREMVNDYDVLIQIPSKTPVRRHYMTGEPKTNNQSLLTMYDVEILSDMVDPGFPLSVTAKAGTAVVYEFGATETDDTPGTIGVPDRILSVGYSLEIPLRHFVSGTGPFTFAATGPGIDSLDADTGLLTMTSMPGTYTVTATATNAGGGTQTTFDVTVDGAMIQSGDGSTTTGWTVGDNTTLTTTGTRLRATADADGAVVFHQQISGLVSGGVYRLHVDAEPDAGGNNQIDLYFDAGTDFLDPDFNTGKLAYIGNAVERDWYVVAGSSSSNLGIKAVGLIAGDYIEIGGLSLVRVM